MEHLNSILERTISKAQEYQQRTPAERRQFEEDCAAYDAEAQTAKAEIFKMVCHMPAPGVEQDPNTAAAVYWDFLKGELSPENITAVCRAAMRGSVMPDNTFRPTVAKLLSYGSANFQRRSAVRCDPRLGVPNVPRLAAPEHKLLGAEYDDEQFRDDERARIRDGLIALGTELRATGQISTDQLADLPDRKQTPPQLSPELRGKLGLDAP